MTKEEVQKLAKLSKIKLSEEEVKKFQEELSNILQYVEQLNEVNTDGVEPTSQVTGLENVSRKDKEESYDTDHADLMSNVPEEKDGYIKTPRVF